MPFRNETAMRPSVLVTRALPGEALERLKLVAEVDINTEDRELSREELKARIHNKQAVISLLVNPMDKEMMDAAPNLQVIANYAVGYNNIDVAEATKRGIVVTNTPDVLTDATADMTWALLLGIARRVPEGDLFMREGRFAGWYPTLLLGGSVTGKTMGIIGIGRIGQAVAERAYGFNMPILYHNRRRLAPEIEKKLSASYVSLEELLERSDFVSIHSPYSAETHHLIGERQLKLMKRTAYLINTSRGPLVDEHALVAALRDQLIAGAGLDVFEREPEMEPGLADLPNVVLAPHVGSATVETRVAMTELVVDNVIAVLQGGTPPTPVNPEAIRKS
jgi:glyoxylate reductase